MRKEFARLVKKNFPEQFKRVTEENLKQFNDYYMSRVKITKKFIKNLITEKKGIAKLVLKDIFNKVACKKQTQKELQEAFISSFNDLLNYGTNNGSISRLIYYADTHAFFNKYYKEIEVFISSFNDLLNYGTNNGSIFKIDSDLKDFFARFSYEETARKLARELEIEA